MIDHIDHILVVIDHIDHKIFVIDHIDHKKKETGILQPRMHFWFRTNESFATGNKIGFLL